MFPSTAVMEKHKDLLHEDKQLVEWWDEVIKELQSKLQWWKNLVRNMEIWHVC